MSLIPLDQPAAGGQFGPQISIQEQQTKTFEALWKDLQDNYIYSKTANIDWVALHSKYLELIHKGLTPDEFTALMKDLMSELPAGSLVYESRAERIESETSSNGLIGMFAGFSKDPQPHIVVLDVIKDSPAEQAGLKAHDSILKIDGNPILLDEGIAILDRIHGPAGSTVTFTVQSPGGPERSMEIKRGTLTSTSQLKALNVTGTNYGYLLFPPRGYDTLTEDVMQALQSFAAGQQLGGLILDLRVASSTEGWPLENIYGMFASGTLGEIYNRNNQQPIEVTRQDISNSQDVPLVILVGKNTRGFPEVLAGSLQLHKRAVVIGETTAGDIGAMTGFYLPDGSQAFIESTSVRLLPGNEEIANTGVIPDIPVKGSWDQILPNQDPVLDRAVQYLDGKK